MSAPKFDLKTDWSQWEVWEDGYVVNFRELDAPEMGCVVCDGYASWEVTGSWNPQAARIIQCSNCLLADATDPRIPGEYVFKP